LIGQQSTTNITPVASASFSHEALAMHQISPGDPAVVGAERMILKIRTTACADDDDDAAGAEQSG
jgi:hypothetical protein